MPELAVLVPVLNRLQKMEALIDRLVVQVSFGDCWLWSGRTNGAGYGQVYLGRTADGKKVSRSAHRVFWELSVGPIPEGFQLDHLCRTPRCVNPDHLEPVTQRENLVRGVGWAGTNSRKTSCPKGHPLEGSNLCAGPRRKCRTCKQERDRSG